MVAICLVVLTFLTLVLTVEATRAEALRRRLAEHGVPVQITVTRCLGLASGTGITPVGYTCRGSFTLADQHYNDVIEGTARRYLAGATLTGITDPGDPAHLFTSQSVASAPAAWRGFVVPVILIVLLSASCGLAVRLKSRSEGDPASTAGGVARSPLRE